MTLSNKPHELRYVNNIQVVQQSEEKTTVVETSEATAKQENPAPVQGITARLDPRYQKFFKMISLVL